MNNAESVFVEMLSKARIIPDESAYCSLIGGFVERGDLNTALDWLIRMLDAGNFFLNLNYSL